MASHNLYLSYKRDTKYLLYWMINVSNRILRENGGETHPTIKINTTGQATVNSVLPMSSLIADHADPVPNVIYRLFGSIIHARSLVSSTFQQFMGAVESDDELQRSNESHQHFIKTLQQAFQILGGEEWEKTHKRSDNTEDIEEIFFVNKFEKIAVGKDEESSDEEDDEPSQVPAAARKVAESLKERRAKRAKHTRSQRREGNKTHKIQRPLKCPLRVSELLKILEMSVL